MSKLVAVIAVSGGVDSMVLARILVPILRGRGVEPLIAHYNHGLRREDGEADERSCVLAGNLSYWRSH